MAFVYKEAKETIQPMGFHGVLNSFSPTILYSGRKVRIILLVVSSENCGLRTVNLAVNYIPDVELGKLDYFSRIVGGRVSNRRSDTM